jgi:hypothetical protein
MKPFLLTIAISIVSVYNSIAQQNHPITPEQLKSFKTATLYIVSDDASMAYNIGAKAAFEKCWTMTPIKFINSTEFETLRKINTNAFVLMTRTTMTKDKRQVEYQYINFLMGDSCTNMNKMPEILTFPLAYTGTDDNAYTAKLPLIVRFAQNHITEMLSAQNLRRYFKLKKYNRNIKDIKTQTLLVAREDLGVDANSIEKIKAKYPYTVKITSADSVQMAIDQKLENTAIVYIIKPGDDGAFGRSYKMIFGTSDAKLYFFHFLNIYNQQPGGFMLRDFKRISCNFNF